MPAYTKRIEIQVLSDGSDTIGNQGDDWTTLTTAWATAQATTGKEYIEAAQVNAENDVTFRLRYSARIHALHPSEVRIIYNGKAYDVKRIVDYRELHQFLEIRAVEINGA